MDRGPHSHTCANAESGECFCDCRGTMHGVTHLPGHKHKSGTTITAVKGGGGTHYRVIGPGGLPPGGGTKEERIAHHASQVKVTGTSQRPHTLSPHLAAHAAATRATMPKTADEWTALVPRAKSERQGHLDQAADYQARADTLRTRRQEALDRIKTSMAASGMTPAEIRRETTPAKLRRYGDIQNAEGGIAHWEEAAQRARDYADTASTDTPMAYPRDANYTRMPPPEMNRHLDQVLDVGRQALTEVHQAFDRDQQLTELRADLDRRIAILDQLNALRNLQGEEYFRALPRRNELEAQLPGGWRTHGMRAIRRRESEIIREVLANARPMGGTTHHNANPLDAAQAHAMSSAATLGPTGARVDWRDRLTVGESYYPAAWLDKSAANPLDVISSDRAFYLSSRNMISLSIPRRDRDVYNGAFVDATDEVTVHELGHRMEQYIPGLTALEFAFVRRRSTGPDGNLYEKPRKLTDIYSGGGYEPHEKAFEDKWANAYAGKTYEGWDDKDPASRPWEVFQVGVQDLFGRGTRKFGDDELQAFVLGALLTLP